MLLYPIIYIYNSIKKIQNEWNTKKQNKLYSLKEHREKC
jgi:hypothetical protein